MCAPRNRGGGRPCVAGVSRCRCSPGCSAGVGRAPLFPSCRGWSPRARVGSMSRLSRLVISSRLAAPPPRPPGSRAPAGLTGWGGVKRLAPPDAGAEFPGRAGSGEGGGSRESGGVPSGRAGSAGECVGSVGEEQYASATVRSAPDQPEYPPYARAPPDNYQFLWRCYRCGGASEQH